MWIRCAPGDEPTTATARPGGLCTSRRISSHLDDRACARHHRDGGLLFIKAHIFKTGGGITMLDGSMPRTATISNGSGASWTAVTAMHCGGPRLRRWPADVGRHRAENPCQPQGLDADVGADFLTRCFGTRGARRCTAVYAAPFRRRGSRSAGSHGRERVVACCGIVYRLLRTPDGTAHRISVIVAGGTLPGERGRGFSSGCCGPPPPECATRSHGSVRICRTRQILRSLLSRLGATGIASAYIVSRGLSRDAGEAPCGYAARR